MVVASSRRFSGYILRVRLQLVAALAQCRQLYQLLECQQQWQLQQQQRQQCEWRLPLIHTHSVTMHKGEMIPFYGVCVRRRI